MATNLQIFRGNANLKSAGVQLDFTKERVEELTKCYNDPVYFIKNYIKIVHVDRGLVPFDLYPYQEDMVRLILGERRVIMCLPRQSGKCSCKNTKIRVKNKKTGENYELDIGDFYAWQRFRDIAGQFFGRAFFGEMTTTTGKS